MSVLTAQRTRDTKNTPDNASTRKSGTKMVCGWCRKLCAPKRPWGKYCPGTDHREKFEKVVKRVEGKLRVAIREAVSEMLGASDDRWVGVGDGMPPCGQIVLAYYKNGHSKGRRVRARYIGKFEEEATDDMVDAGFYEYDLDSELEYVPLGWYEVVDNCDEFGYYSIADDVTHWTDLPEPPKPRGLSE